MTRDCQQKNPAERMLAEAIAHHQAGSLMKAEPLYRNVMELMPGHADALYRLAVLCIQDGRPEQALPLLQEILQSQPRNPGVLNALGAAMQDTGRHQEGINYFRRALAVDPTSVSTLDNLGKALFGTGDFKAARDCLEKVLVVRPNDPETLIRVGRCRYEASEFETSVSCFKDALRQKPESIEALCGLAASLWGMGRMEDARASLEAALQFSPGNARVLTNLGELLYGHGKVEEALDSCNRALAHTPHFPAALWRKGLALLATGEYREGWKLYAGALGQPDLRGPNIFAPKKPWDGKPAPDKHLLIWGEQGLGDVLQFIRYAALCKQRVGRVSVFCQKPLVRLFKALPFVDEVSDACDKNGFDEHVPVMNLPHLFDTLPETVPAAIPYLRVDPEIREKWAARFNGKTGLLRVGLAWAGGSHKESVMSSLTDRQRSISLERMKPLLDVQGIRFYSLQKGEPAAQIAALGLSDRITDFMDEAGDFADTAALVENLDLIITVDTSVAHLAGGLGKPVWILSRFNADWRWLRNRPANPWYPTARIFGQPAMGDWHSVIEDVKDALRQRVGRI